MKNWLSAVELLSRTNSIFVIPVYQRDYVWTDKQIKQLLDDVLEIIKNYNNYNNHFLGIIMDYKDKEKSISKYYVIDGQQRLITLFLIFYALKSRAKREHNEQIVDKIGNMLTNNRTDDSLKIKLKPIARDEHVYKKIVYDDTASLIGEERATKIYKAYLYIKNIVSKEWREIGYNVEQIYSALDKLKIVEVPLSNDDNVQQIFESINATGLPLSLIDLIRNFIIMQDSNKEATYNGIWQTIENMFYNQKDLEQFFRFFLMNRKRKFISTKNIYNEFKDWLKEKLNDNSDVKTILGIIKQYAEYYHDLYLKDLSEIDGNVVNSIHEFRQIKSDMPAPFMLEIYSLLKEEQITCEDFNKIVVLLNSFIVRRAIIGMNTSPLTRFFTQLLKNLMEYCDGSYSNIVEYCEMFIIQNNLNKVSRMPTDMELKESLKDLNVYGYKDVLHCFFDKLENIDNPNPLDTMKFEIEHVMPQDITKWAKILNVSEDEYLKQINRLGNLTLINKKDNISMSNNLFEYKQDILKDNNHLRMNTYLFELKKWDFEEIDKRTNYLIDKIIELYPYRLSNSVLIPQNPSPKKLPGIKDMVNWGLLQIGDKLEIKNHPNSVATLVEYDKVDFDGRTLSLNQWGCAVTGWKAIQIYVRANKVGEEETLDEKRKKYMDEHDIKY